MGGSSYNRQRGHIGSTLYSPPLVANGVLGGLTECQSVLHEGSNLHCDARTGQGEGPFHTPKNLYIPLCPVLGREILVLSRLGPRMESATNMSEQTHDNMSASHWRCGNVTVCVLVRSLLLARSEQCTEYQCLSVVKQAGMRRSTLNFQR